MKLTAEQLNEIHDFISMHVKYRETCEELFDHLLNALEIKDEAFSLLLVAQIVKEDFGSFELIVEEEKHHRKHVTVKYSKLLWREVLNSFEVPRCFIYIFICWYFYGIYNSIIPEKLMINIMYVLAIVVTFPGVYYFYKRYFIDRRFEKPSLIYNFMNRTWLIGFSIVISIIGLVVQPTALFSVNEEAKFFVLFGTTLLTDIYVRSFKRLFDSKINMLPATRVVIDR